MAASGGIVVVAKAVSSLPPRPPTPSHNNLSTKLYTSSPIKTTVRRRMLDSKLFRCYHYPNINYTPTPSTTTLCKAVGDASATSSTVYQGIYGPWTVDSDDVREVILYRSGLVTAAASFVAAASAAFLPDNAGGLIVQNLDLFFALGGGGLGLSLVLIHIYVTEIKRTLQAMWVLGVLGSAVTYTSLAAPAGQGLVQYVVDNPTAIWFVGPLFAALTGLVFKEGLCYGKLEAGLLTFIIPTVLLGHLTGLMDDGVKLALLGSWMALFVIFAGRKFSQPIKDDIGDKSVFMFNSLSEDEKKALIEKLEQQKLGQSLD